MLTLGIHDGHTATACILRDGEVVACVSEERINRVKEWGGFPEGAVRMCLEIAGCEAAEMDAVGVCSIMPQSSHASYDAPPLFKRAFGGLTRIAPGALLRRPGNIGIARGLARLMFGERRRGVIERLRALGVVTPRVAFHDHHELHAATAYFTSWNRGRRTLVLTLDGSGDAVCASVSMGEGGSLRTLSEVFNYNSVCEFYTRITQHLGMKPMSHEYKVMGLAPYAPEEGTRRALLKLRGFFKLPEGEPFQFHNTSGLWKWRYLDDFARRLRGERFDCVAGAAQALFEELVLGWVRNSIAAAGCGDLALSGGGFMNVKLNYAISRLPEVSSLFIFPSCGDESNSVGAAIAAATGEGFPPEGIRPLGMVYWGPEYGEREIEMALERKARGAGVKVERVEDGGRSAAAAAASGRVVGRFTGRMEWGARALGNRSIVADPRNPAVVHRINRAIKMRDFWMPFAPAVLEEYRNIYLKLREDFQSPFMTVAPDTTSRAWEDMPAALHAFDRTARAQVLSPARHPAFHAMVSHFERLTGVGAVLNTSFNLHGEPIVCTPEDAIDTFLRSGIDVLQLEDRVLTK